MMNAMARESFQRLSGCPLCDYPLEGLPDHYHCPECGFEFDKSMRRFGPPKEIRLLRGVSRTLLFTAITGMFAAGVGLCVFRSWVVLPAYLLLVVARLVYNRWFDPKGDDVFVLLSDSGIVVVGRRPPGERYTWQQVSRITASRLFRSVVLHSPTGTKIASLSFQLFGGAFLAETFVTAATRRRREFEASLPRDGETTTRP
jgi:hypothetical protein